MQFRDCSWADEEAELLGCAVLERTGKNRMEAEVWLLCLVLTKLHSYHMHENGDSPLEFTVPGASHRIGTLFISSTSGCSELWVVLELNKKRDFTLKNEQIQFVLLVCSKIINTLNLLKLNFDPMFLSSLLLSLQTKCHKPIQRHF